MSAKHDNGQAEGAVRFFIWELWQKYLGMASLDDVRVIRIFLPITRTSTSHYPVGSHCGSEQTGISHDAYCFGILKWSPTQHPLWFLRTHSRASRWV